MAKAPDSKPTRAKRARSVAANEAEISRRKQPPTPSLSGVPYTFVAIHDSIWDYEERTSLVDEHKARIGRLISNGRMKKEWERLKRRESSIAPWFDRNGYPEVPLVNPWGASMVPLPNPWEVLYLQIMAALKRSSAQPVKWSTTKLERAYADIESQSRKLAADLRKVYDNELTDITAFLDSSTLRNLAIALGLDILKNPPADVDPEHALKLRLRFLPNLPELLNLLAERVKKLKAQRTQKQSRPASVGAQCRPFISHISNYFFLHYGARLHATVATITSIIFNRKVSTDLVKKQLKRAAS
jgi:hypothetical protein